MGRVGGGGGGRSERGGGGCRGEGGPEQESLLQYFTE